MSDADNKKVSSNDDDSGSTSQIDKIGAPSLNTSVESNHTLLETMSRNVLQVDRHKDQSESSTSSERQSLDVNIPNNDTQSVTTDSEDSNDGISILSSLAGYFTRPPKNPSRLEVQPQPSVQNMDQSDSTVTDSYESVDVLELHVNPESPEPDMQSKFQDQLENVDIKKPRSLSAVSDSSKSSYSHRSRKSSSIESLYLVQLKDRSQQWSPLWSRNTSQQWSPPQSRNASQQWSPPWSRNASQQNSPPRSRNTSQQKSPPRSQTASQQKSPPQPKISFQQSDDPYYNSRKANTNSAYMQTDPELEMRGTQTSTHTSLKKQTSTQNVVTTNPNSKTRITQASTSNPTFSSQVQTEEKQQMSKPIQNPSKPTKNAANQEEQSVDTKTQTLEAHKSIDMLKEKYILNTLPTLVQLNGLDHESHGKRLTQDKKSCPVCELFDEMYTLAGDLVLNSSIMMETYRQHRERHVEKAKLEITNFHKWNKKLKEMETQLSHKKSEHRGKQHSFHRLDMSTDRLDVLSPSKSRHSSEDLFSILSDDIYEESINTSSRNHSSKKSYNETSRKSSKETVRHKHSHRSTPSRRHEKRSHSCRNSDDNTDERDSSNSQNRACHCRRRSPQRTECNCDCLCDCKKPKTASCQCRVWDFSSNKQQCSSMRRNEKICYKHIDLDHDEDFHDLEPKLKQILKDVLKTIDQRQKAKPRSDSYKSSLKVNEQRKEKAIEKEVQEIKSTKLVQRSSQLNENNSTQTGESAVEEEDENGRTSVLENMAFFMLKEDSRKSKEVQTEDEKYIGESKTQKSSSTSTSQHEFTPDPTSAEAIPDFITALKSAYMTLCNEDNSGENGTPRSSGNRSTHFRSNFNLNDPKILELVTNIITSFCSQYLGKDDNDEYCNSGTTSNSCSQEVLSPETQTLSTMNATVCQSGENVEGNRIPAYFYPVCYSNQAQYQPCYPCQQHVHQISSCGLPCECNSIIPLQEAFKQYSVCYQSIQTRQQCMSNVRRSRKPEQIGCQRNSRQCRLSTGTSQSQPQSQSNQVQMPCIVGRNSCIKPVTYVIPSNRVYWQNM